MGKIVIGAIGHRILAEPDRLAAAVDDALRRLPAGGPDCEWVVLSSLAEGADRLIAERAMAVLGARLVAVLPLPPKRYEQDFGSEASRQQFRRLLGRAAERVIPAPHASRPEAYRTAGRYVADHSDALIAIWDGEMAQGTGGTGEIVASARERGMPVAWIEAGNREPETEMPTSLGATQGRVHWERLERHHESRLQRAFRERDAGALQYQQRRWGFARFATVLGPVAVLLLATQVLAFPAGGVIGSLLILAELLALAVALGLTYLVGIARAHDRWIKARLRAELLRREIFLLRTGAGPYLGLSDEALAERVSQRLLVLDDDLRDPESVLPLGEEGRRWCMGLGSRLPGAPGDEDARVPGGLHATMCAYLKERVADQRSWFARKSKQLADEARRYENLAKGILILALVVAAIHLGLLQGADHGHAGWLHGLLIFLALTAPAFGSAAIALQSITGSHRLSRSYGYHQRALEPLEARLRQLVAAAGAATGGTDGGDPPAGAGHGEPAAAGVEPGSTSSAARVREFRAVVIEVEELLTTDLLVWWMIMRSEVPRAAA